MPGRVKVRRCPRIGRTPRRSPQPARLARRTHLESEQRLARLDSLTGVLNGRACEQEAGRLLALAERRGHLTTIAYLDLDDFKAVNDTLGHHGGDELLRVVSQTLRAGVRRTNLVVRLGGDEFARFLPETDLESVRTVIGRLRARLAEVRQGDGRPFGMSVGVATFTTAPATLEAAIHIVAELI